MNAKQWYQRKNSLKFSLHRPKNGIDGIPSTQRESAPAFNPARIVGDFSSAISALQSASVSALQPSAISVCSRYQYFQMASSSESESMSGSTSIPKEAEKPQIEPIRMPTIEEVRGQDIWNNCAVRSVVSGVMGGGLGLFMGLFLGALDNPLMQEEMSAKKQFIFTAKQMGRRSWSSAKAFAVMGFIFSAAECVVEKARAKHDMTNTVVAGCVTGGSISAKGGPQAACVGCAGFAAFSVLIEKFLDRHD